jgi:Glycosyltransferase family 87
MDSAQHPNTSRAIRTPRRTWPPSLSEATAHARILAILLWIAGLVVVLLPSGPYDLFGEVKGADFVHFYTVGTVARNRQPELLYDHAALHQLQVALIPASDKASFLSVYPPQTAVAFAPFSLFPYVWAACLWALTTAAVYSGVTAIAARDVAIPRGLLIAALAGFPPFVDLIFHGQTTAWALAAFGLGGAAFIAGKRFLAGIAFGLLVIKPQLGLVLAAVLLATLEWRIIAGILVCWLAQVALTSAVLGTPIWEDYAEIVGRLPAFRQLLEPRPQSLHSLAAFTDILPTRFQTWGWLVLSAPVVYLACRVWRQPRDPWLKMAALVLASVLVSPHLVRYDATLVALPMLWIAREWNDARFVTGAYLLVLTLLVPFKALIGVQLSTFAILWLFYRVTLVRIPGTA